MMATTNSGMRLLLQDSNHLVLQESQQEGESLEVNNLPLDHAREAMKYAKSGFLGTKTASLVFQVTQ